jgi:hypothetical protein
MKCVLRATLAIILLFFSIRIQAAEQKYDLIYPRELIKLAESLGMEPIGGEDFWDKLTIYGGQGLPYIFNLLTAPEEGKSKVPASVVFWCQKGGKKFLVYAVDSQENPEYCNYKIKDIVSRAQIVGHDYNIEGSCGIIVYEGILGNTKDLSHFTYLDNPNEYGPKDIFPTALNGFLPIIRYHESSVIVLYRYKDRWLKYVEIDE